MSKTYISTDKDNHVIVIRENYSPYCLDFVQKETDQKDFYTDKPVLRYPGGKTRAVKLIISLIPPNITQLCSPFIGGGSVELACATRGITTTTYDLFLPLVEFWQHLLSEPERLAREIEKYYPLPKAQFYELQKIQHNLDTRLKRAAVFYVLNRCSYSGATLSGGMSPDHPRFTNSSIQRIRDFHNPNIQVHQMDFQDSIPLHKDTFLYLDPPYLIKNSLYGKNGNTHRDFDHEALLYLLRKRNGWILSYNNCSEILEMYTDYKILFPIWKYGMSNDKNAREVLILSKDVQHHFNL